jgi:hypothetical protein
MLSFQLSKGILLEDSGILLPWNAQLKHLRKTGTPNVQRERGRTTLYWNDRRFLGGLSGSIEAAFDLAPSSDESEADPNDGKRLRFVSFDLDSEPKETPRQQYLRIKRRLTRSLGKPSRAGEDPAWNLPLAEWNLARVLLVWMVFERFGEYCVGEVWRKPLPKWREEEAEAR